jgi:hypothetical protein
MHKPNQILFPGQQPNETIHLIFRQHWIVLFQKIIVWGFFLLAYLAIDYFSLTYLLEFIDPAFLPLIEVAKLGFLMFIVLGLFIVLILYYLTIHIVTNERIVDIDQAGVMHHTISELHLDQIQDVTAEVHGLPENLFDYGDVYIQTAGETQRFMFNKIPNPTKVTKLILDLYEQLPEQKKNNMPPPPTPPQQ